MFWRLTDWPGCARIDTPVRCSSCSPNCVGSLHQSQSASVWTKQGIGRFHLPTTQQPNIDDHQKLEEKLPFLLVFRVERLMDSLLQLGKPSNRTPKFPRNGLEPVETCLLLIGLDEGL